MMRAFRSLSQLHSGSKLILTSTIMQGSTIRCFSSPQFDVPDPTSIRQLPSVQSMHPSMKRSHTIKDLLHSSNRNSKIILNGWIQNVRMVKNNMIFIVLRDHTGCIQLLLEPESFKESVHMGFEGIATRLRSENHLENTVCIKGIFQERPTKMKNPEMKSGQYEVRVEEMTLFNDEPQLSFNPTHSPLPDEEIRLVDRFLDLRRPELQNNIRMRAKGNAVIHKYMSDLGFLEIETPILFKSTPEGAREFLVNADRIKEGSNYALPQSPQQFKQMLMAAGMDRYYQLARCFRDEDLRADRQPEFTQLDVEMSFCTMEDVMAIMEGLFKSLATELNALGTVSTPAIGTHENSDWKKNPFSRLTYDKALGRYGCDKPDLRFPFEISLLASETESGPNGCQVELTEVLSVPSEVIVEDTLRLAIAEGIKPDRIGDKVLFVASRKLRDHVGTTKLGKIRNSIIRRVLSDTVLLKTYRIAEHVPIWVYDFPLLALSSAEGQAQLRGHPRRVFEHMHHPFTAPHPDDLPLLTSEPLSVRGQHYDLVFDGCEVGGGSIRIHSATLQEFILRDIIQLPEQYVQHFDHLMRALKAGCPPHGGMAFGLDRLYALFCGAGSIRDVIAFPKNGQGVDLCVRAPS